jgi:ABC-type sugar transport system permease subunit
MLFSPAMILVVLVTILPICTGFQSSLTFKRLLLKRNVVEKDTFTKISTFQELVNAVIEAIPAVLKPAKEMDLSRVKYNPPKFVKV